MAASQVSSPNPSALGGSLRTSTAADYRAANLGFGKLLVAFLGAAERAVDGVAIVAGLYCAYALYRLLGLGSQVQYPASTVLLSAGGFALLFVILLERRGGYRPYVGLLAVRDTERILRVTVESFLLALLAAYFTTQPISRLIVLLAAVTVPVFVIFAKWEMRQALRLLRAKGYGTRRAVIIGAGTLGRRIYSALLRSPKFGLEPVAFVDDDPQKSGLEIYESSYQRRRAAKVFAGPACPGVLRELDANVLVIATPGADREVMVRLAAATGVDTYCVREDFSEPGFWIDYAEFDGITLAHFSKVETRIVGDVARNSERCTGSVHRFLWMGLAAASYLLVLLSFRRTYWGELAIGSFILLLLQRRRFRNLAVAGTMLCLAALVLGKPFADRVQSLDVMQMDGEFSADNSDHVHDLEDAWDQVRQSPLLGIGVGTSYPTWRIRNWKNESVMVHNAPIHVWLKYGLAGLIFYLWFHIALLGWLYRRSKYSGEKYAKFLSVAFAFLAAQFVMTLGFAPWPYSELQLTTLISFILAAAFLSASRPPLGNWVTEGPPV